MAFVLFFFFIISHLFRTLLCITDWLPSSLLFLKMKPERRWNFHPHNINLNAISRPLKMVSHYAALLSSPPHFTVDPYFFDSTLVISYQLTHKHSAIAFFTWESCVVLVSLQRRKKVTFKQEMRSCYFCIVAGHWVPPCSAQNAMIIKPLSVYF